MPKSSIFTPLEKEILIDLMSKYKSILENKENNAKSIAHKEEVWTILGKEFNSSIGVTERSVKQLKALWKNMKTRAKTDVAAVRRSNVKTGGGPSDVKVGVHTEQVCALLPTQIQSLRNDFDDDAVFHGCTATKTNDETTTSCRNTAPPATEPTSSAVNLVSLPSDDEEPQSRALQQMIRSQETYVPSSKTRNTCSASYKDRFLDLAKEEHDLKINYMKVEHKTKILHMEEEHKKRMAVMRLEEDILLLKKRKLMSETKVSGDSCTSGTSLWQPF